MPTTLKNLATISRSDRLWAKPGRARCTATVVHSLEMERALRIAAQQPRARAALAFLGDKRFLFSSSGNAFLMYRRSGLCFVAMGDPVGCEIEWPELIRTFNALAKSARAWPVYYQIEPRSVPLYRAEGLSCRKLGEEASISLSDFSLDGSHRRRLRQTLRRTERGGGSVDILTPASVHTCLDDLRNVSDAWLAAKNTREKGFSLGAFETGYLSRCPIAVVRQHDRVVAFANLWLGSSGGEVGVDLMRYTPEAPYGVMEYLFVKLFEWGREQGFSRFTMGMAPLAGLEPNESKSLWDRCCSALYHHGEYFYNFRGVREYKAKFQPEWEPRYLASPGGIRLPIELAAVGSLIAGGVRGMMAR